MSKKAEKVFTLEEGCLLSDALLAYQGTMSLLIASGTIKKDWAAKRILDCQKVREVVREHTAER
jgi:hypothetical protein